MKREMDLCKMKHDKEGRHGLSILACQGNSKVRQRGERSEAGRYRCARVKWHVINRTVTHTKKGKLQHHECITMISGQDS